MLPGLPLNFMGGASGGAASFPIIIGTNTDSQNNFDQSHNINLPASISVGDLIIMFYNGGTVDSGPGGDWTPLVATGERWCWYKIADGSEPATESVGTVLNDIDVSNTYLIDAGTFDPDTPVEVASDADLGTGSTLDGVPITASWGADKNLFISWVAYTDSGNRSLSSFPAGYSGGISAKAFNSDVSRTAIGASAHLAALAATEDPGVFTFSSSAISSQGITVVIRGL